tara:strand:- start:583 stop:957 length:375 start_codon:yes stop_codon:yes gene_type:complete
MAGLFKPTKEEAKTAKNRKGFIIYEHEGRSVGATTNLSRKLKGAKIMRSNVNVLHGIPEGTMTLREVWELMVQEQKNKDVPVADTDEDWECFLVRHTSPDGDPQRIQLRGTVPREPDPVKSVEG